MDWIQYIVATLFAILGLGCLLLVVIQLPGGWILLVLALLIEWADSLYLSGESTITFGWPILGICAGLLIVGEVIEFLAGVIGAKKGGATRRGMIGSLVGCIVGALVLAGMLPFLLGFGALIGALIGTFAGAVIGEMTGAEARTMRESMKPALGAAVGRAVAAVSKVGITIVVWGALVGFAFWP